MITIDDFNKVDIRVGEIISAEKVPDSKKLLRLMVDVSEDKPRQIISGIAKYFSVPDALIGQKCMFLVNIEPRTMGGLESQGMILAVSTDDDVPDAGPGKFSLLLPDQSIPKGTRVR